MRETALFVKGRLCGIINKKLKIRISNFVLVLYGDGHVSVVKESTTKFTGKQ